MFDIFCRDYAEGHTQNCFNHKEEAKTDLFINELYTFNVKSTSSWNKTNVSFTIVINDLYCVEE